MCQLQIQPHPFDPINCLLIDMAPNQSLDQILSELRPEHQAGSSQPLIARVNGVQIDPVNWGATQIAPNDIVNLRPRPFGFEVAIAIFSIASAAYSYMQMRKMKALQTDYRDLPEQSPTYDLNAQGNSARLGQPVPIGYGYQRIYPDFAAKSYRRYENGQQYLYNLFSVGQGKYELSGKRIGSTEIDRFEGIEEKLYAPGEIVELFSPDVETSDEISNLDLHAPNDAEYSGWSGPFAACAVDVQCTRIELDFIANGLYQQNDDGDLVNATVTAEAEYRAIDANGVPQGNWLALITHSIIDNTVDVIRHSVGQDVPLGRYEVQVRRTNTTDNGNSRLRDDLIWAEMRAVIYSDRSYDHTVWAVKILVTGQLSGTAGRKFNCMSQRLVDVWTGSEWLQDQASRNIAWAFCDLIKGKYGGGYSDEYLDLPTIKRLADIWDSRSDYFDYRFDTKGTLDSGLQLICRAGRAVKVEYDGVYSIVRDEPKNVADYQFGMTEIVSNSVKIEYLTLDQWADDSVKVSYIDNETGLPETVICALPGSTADRPRKLKLEGVTNRIQAMREGMFEAARAWYRNRTVTFKTELAGGLPDFGSSVAVSHVSSQWGTSGEVQRAERKGNDTVLTLSEDVLFADSETHVIQLADTMGRPVGPFIAIAGADSNQVVISEQPLIYAGHKKKRTGFQFGIADKHNRRFIMRNIVPAGELQFTLTGEYDNPIVHSFDAMIDSGTIPLPAPTPVFSDELEQVRGLLTRFTGDITSPVLHVTWSPVANAERYMLQVSRNDGATWQSLVSLSEQFYKTVFDKSINKIRIAAMSDLIGPWVEQSISLTAEDSDLLRPNVPTGVVLAEPFTGRHCKIKWDSELGISNWRVSIYDDTGAIKRTVGTANPEYSYSYKDAEGDGVGRTFTVKVWALDSLGASSTQSADLTVTNSQIGALGAVQVEAIIDQAIITITAPNESDYAGVRVWQGSDSNFVVSVFNQSIELSAELVIPVPLPTDGSTVYLRVGGMDVWGDDDLAVSAAYSVTRRLIEKTDIKHGSIETPHLAANAVTAGKITAGAVTAAKIAANAITADKLDVNALSAVSADLGTVAAGKMMSSDGKFVIDLDNKFISIEV